MYFALSTRSWCNTITTSQGVSPTCLSDRCVSNAGDQSCFHSFTAAAFSTKCWLQRTVLRRESLASSTMTPKNSRMLRSGGNEIGKYPVSTSYTILILSRYTGALLFNFAAFLLPALHGTLSKLWIANIDNSLVELRMSTICVVTEVLNEGLPRAAWVVIGDKSYLAASSLGPDFAYTLIILQGVPRPHSSECYIRPCSSQLCRWIHFGRSSSS
jgi:hypothetical protein